MQVECARQHCFGSLGDIPRCPGDVRFALRNDHRGLPPTSPFDFPFISPRPSASVLLKASQSRRAVPGCRFRHGPRWPDGRKSALSRARINHALRYLRFTRTHVRFVPETDSCTASNSARCTHASDQLLDLREDMLHDNGYAIGIRMFAIELNKSGITCHPVEDERVPDERII